MDHREAQQRVLTLVNEALDAGLEGRARPEPVPMSDYKCTDDQLSPTGKLSPGFSYSFPYSSLGIDGRAFAQKATDT